jgi:hypothetical protein
VGSAAFCRRDLLYAAGYVSSAFVALALGTVIVTKPTKVEGSAPR